MEQLDELVKQALKATELHKQSNGTYLIPKFIRSLLYIWYGFFF